MKTDKTRVFNMDCMDYMRSVEDGYFELAVVDPPYGINADKKNNGSNSDYHRRHSKAKIKSYKTGWDSVTQSIDFFLELKRISKKQVVWGVNYYPYSNLFIGGRLFWDKGVTMPTYSKGELAYISWLNSIDYVKIDWHGMIQQDMKHKESRIHPTQKPVKLYEWILMNYAKEGDKVLDTHLGSGSSRIAAYNLGFDFIGIELDEEYFNASCDRFNTHKSQLTLFL